MGCWGAVSWGGSDDLMGNLFTNSEGPCSQLVFDLSVKMPVANGWVERKRRDLQVPTSWKERGGGRGRGKGGRGGEGKGSREGCMGGHGGRKERRGDGSGKQTYFTTT